MMTSIRLNPELILLNGNFITMDKNHPNAQALAISGNRIFAIGSNQYIREMAIADTQTIDLQGNLVLPGMIDSHFHFYDWAMGREQLALAEVKSFSELIELVSKTANTLEPGTWIVGQGWNESDWPEHKKPMRDDLDIVAPLNPVALWRCDLHLVSVNSKALELAGIDEHTPDPIDGIIEKGDSGKPNGILRELAPNLIKAVIPNPSQKNIVKAIKNGITHLHSLGLTGIHDARLMGGLEGAPALNAWQVLNEKKELDLRAWVSLSGEYLDQAIGLGLRTGLGDNRLRIGHVKYFADGGMGARTAWMLEPYLDAEYGMPIGSIKELKKEIKKAETAGLAVMIHAIGDRTNRELIRVFEELETERKLSGNYFPPKIQHRIEHVQMIRSEDIKRLSKLDIAACVQPHNMILDIKMIDESVGHRGRFTYTYKSMIDAGIPTLFSSDAPVCDPNPLAGIHALVTRQRTDRTPEGGWYPEQRLSVEQAIQGYTTVPAQFYKMSGNLGSLTPGKLADLIVLDRNIFHVDHNEIAETRVLLTIFDGKIVYRLPFPRDTLPILFN